MAGSPPWLDLTIRPETAPEVELQPDNTVELSWPLDESGSRITLLLTPDHARSLNERMGLRLLMVEA
jgi:hypothetical protein